MMQTLRACHTKHFFSQLAPTCSHLVSLALHLVYFALTWSHLVSLGLHLVYFALTWSHLLSTWSPLGLFWSHLLSTWFILLSLGLHLVSTWFILLLPALHLVSTWSPLGLHLVYFGLFCSCQHSTWSHLVSTCTQWGGAHMWFTSMLDII